MPIRTSRERLLAAIDGHSVDHPPCSFMLFNALRDRSQSYLDFIQRQIALGLDAYVQIPPRPPRAINDYYNLYGLPVSYDPRVEIEEWVENPPGERWPLLVKEYHTPAGVLRTEVRQTGDWPYGDHVPFLDDYLVPRSRKFLLSGPADLDALRYLLVPPTGAEIAAFQAEAQPVLDFARQQGLLVAGGWGVGADLIGWVYGLERQIYAVYDQPQFVADLLDLIAAWNRQRMAVLLAAGVDLIIKRAWYENTDFWSPVSFQRFLLPILRADAEQAHQAGARFGTIISARAMPLLDFFAEAGVDVLIGVDPDEWDLAEAKRRLAGRVSLWGGVSGHRTVEQGSAEAVRAEVRRALDLLGPDRFILSPVDNVREDTPLAWDNVAALIDEWRGAIGQG